MDFEIEKVESHPNDFTIWIYLRFGLSFWKSRKSGERLHDILRTFLGFRFWF